MSIGIMAARPPHLRFITKPVEDRNESIKAGHTVFTDVHHVVITAQGSKDSVEKPVADWLETTKQQVDQERLPADWAEKYRAAYEHWKRGEEVPVEGTALANWGSITPAQLQNCKSIHILTVEDLAMANDEATRRLGMGGLQLKQLARRFLDASAGPGKLVEENRALQAQLKDALLRMESLEKRVAVSEAAAGVKSPVVETKAPEGIEEKL